MAGHTGHHGDWTGNPWRLARWAIVPVLLLIPLIAMQFSEEVQWTLFDFVFVAVVLSGALIAYEVATRISSLTTYRMAAAVAILTSVMLLWITGAVGVIGTEDHWANLLLLAVIPLAVVGSVIARFRPSGLARTMFVAAGATALIGIVALIAGWGSDTPSWPLDVAGATVMFSSMWAVAGGLFRVAAEGRARRATA